MHNENRELRPWCCKKCGHRVMSKGGMSRDFDMDFQMMALTSNSLGRVVDDPSRKITKGEEMRYLNYGGWRAGPFCEVPGAGNGRDLEIRVTIPDDYDGAMDERGPMTPERALTSFIELLRELPVEKIPKYVCHMTGGHRYEEVAEKTQQEEV